MTRQQLERFSDDERSLIERARALATAAHAGQLRKSGEPYIVHPLAVAAYVAEQGYDAESVTAALLHDVVEDTEVTLGQITEEFGESIAGLVDGVTKLGEIDYEAVPGVSRNRQATSAENMRKLLLAMTRDMRVIIIKLADRRHNMMTLDALRPEQKQRIARETFDIYAPLADRLGMGVLKAELEDLAFKHDQPEAYELVQRLVRENDEESWRYLARLKRAVGELMHDNKVEVSAIDGRRKHHYSIYRKLAKTGNDITKIYDIMALRVIVPTEADCYNALGVIHTRYKPLIYRIKDYIAVPKPNGYRSLHTTVFALDGRITEIQIRTPDMHHEAEHGVAAHMLYDLHKQTKGYKSGQAAVAGKKPSWLTQLEELPALNQAGGHGDLMEALKLDLFQDRLFVFSPKGDLYDLPEGATVLDFAFAIHSDVGAKAYGALVNGRMAPLDRKLENRDVVDVLTRKTVEPNRDWLTFVRTSHARNRIRAWLRAVGRDDNIVTGRGVVESALKTWGYRKLEEVDKDVVEKTINSFGLNDTDSLYAAVGEGAIALNSLMRRLFPPKVRPRHVEVNEEQAKNTTLYRPHAKVLIAGSSELPYSLAACCHPKPGDPVVGYITRGTGITVHHRDCVNLPNEPERWIPAGWEGDHAHAGVVVGLVVQSADRVALVRDITAELATLNINIVQMRSGLRSEGNGAEVALQLLVNDLFQLRAIMAQLMKLPGVTSVARNDSWK